MKQGNLSLPFFRAKELLARAMNTKRRISSFMAKDIGNP